MCCVCVVRVCCVCVLCVCVCVVCVCVCYVCVVYVCLLLELTHCYARKTNLDILPSKARHCVQIFGCFFQSH